MRGAAACVRRGPASRASRARASVGVAPATATPSLGCAGSPPGTSCNNALGWRLARLPCLQQYDADALLTAMFEVEVPVDAPPSFYIQPDAHVSSRVPVALARGDVIAHSYDTQHGVEVPHGRRASVIMWFTEGSASCVASTLGMGVRRV